MKARNSTAPAEGGAEAAQNTKTYLQRKNNKRVPIPQPGTALCAFLKSYRSDLLEFPCHRQISSLVDCCDYILNEVERGQS